MGFFQPDRSGWAHTVSKCQIFGSYCALCARPAQPGIDLCTPCQGLFRATKYTNSQGITTSLCLGCGVQRSLPLQLSGIGRASDIGSEDSNRLYEACAASPPSRFLPGLYRYTRAVSSPHCCTLPICVSDRRHAQASEVPTGSAACKSVRNVASAAHQSTTACRSASDSAANAPARIEVAGTRF